MSSGETVISPQKPGGLEPGTGEPVFQVKICLLRRKDEESASSTRPHVLARISGPCSAALTHGHLRDAMMDVIRALLIDENCTAECQPPTTPADQSPITADAPPPAPTEGTASPLPPLPPLSPSIGDDGLPLLLVEVRAAEDPRGELKIDATWTRAGGSIADVSGVLEEMAERGGEAYVLASCPTPAFPLDGHGADFKSDRARLFPFLTPTSPSQSPPTSPHSSPSPTLQQGLMLMGVKVLHLVPAYLMPPPPVKVRIVGHSVLLDGFGKEYVGYEVRVKHGLLEWTLHKRYSDFDALHEKLCTGEAGGGSILDKATLPKLPAKALRNTESVIVGRQSLLASYLSSLLSLPNALMNVHVLSFLGLLSTSREDLPRRTSITSTAQPEDKAKPRQVMHLSALRRHVEWGDVILFRCATMVSGFQRSVTGAEWDHVGLVVKRDREQGTLDLLESTAEGVTVYPLISRLRAYATEFTYYMALRKLQTERTEAMETRLLQFVSRVDGMPYGFHLKVLFSKKQYKPSSQPPPPPAPLAPIDAPPPLSEFLNDPDAEDLGHPTKADGSASAEAKPEEGVAIDLRHDKGAFFCSELVAEGLRQMGVLHPDSNCSYFWPGAFTTGGEVDTALTEGCRFSEIMLLDCRTVEVGRATVVQSPRAGAEALWKTRRAWRGAMQGGEGSEDQAVVKYA